MADQIERYQMNRCIMLQLPDRTRKNSRRTRVAVQERDTNTFERPLVDLIPEKDRPVQIGNQQTEHLACSPYQMYKISHKSFFYSSV